MQTQFGWLGRSVWTTVTILAFTQALAATDYNNDGRADIAFHRPGSTWSSVPVLFSNGNGSWTSTNFVTPSWANQSGVIAVAGDYNSDGRADIAFHRPGSTWSSVPVLLSNGNGSWTSTNFATPSWANQPGVVAVAGDYDNDGRTDIAFHRPGSTWSSVPVLFSNGNGSWSPTNFVAPSWANQPGVAAVAGDYNNDGRADIAFHRPGSTWSSVPVLFSNGNGSWTATNFSAPSWANQPGVVSITGDFNGDGRTDIAFHRPGSTWNSVPVLFSNGNGSWAPTNFVAPSWANQPGVVSIAGDYNNDGRTDVGFHRPGSTWNSVPVLFSNGNGSWAPTNFVAPSWANQAGVVSIAGDYNGDGRMDIAFHRPGSTWNSVPVLFSNGNGSWNSTNFLAPSWANQAGVAVVETGPWMSRLGFANPPLTPSRSTALYGVDPSLAIPTITSITTTDNAVILTWSDNNTAHTGYIITVWERGSQLGPTEFTAPNTTRAITFLGLVQGPLRPGATYDILLWAIGPAGVSSNTNTVAATLTAPTVIIGIPAINATVSPIVVQAFAPFDADSNGIVNAAAGSGGAFPLFPSSSAGQPVAQAGNAYDTASDGTQANVVLGYFITESVSRFVAFHLFINPITTAITPISILYGDAQPNVPGTLVWVGPPAITSPVVVTSSDPVQGIPSIVQGRVTAPALASDGTLRVVEFSFRLALLNQ